MSPMRFGESVMMVVDLVVNEVSFTVPEKMRALRVGRRWCCVESSYSCI
jgi:hypothetical protein